MATGRGGKRRGAGRPNGSRERKTLEKEAAREFVRQHVTRKLRPLLDAQIANALGVRYLVVREQKTGKFLRVTEAMARVKLAIGEEIVEVWEKDPSVQAFTDLLNRALDKPKEQELELKVSDADGLVARLAAARKRTSDA